MATRLTRLTLDRIDLVDKGANPGAIITLFKRDDAMSKAKTPEEQLAEVQKKLDEQAAQITALTKRAEDAEAARAKAETDLKAVQKAKPADPTDGMTEAQKAELKKRDDEIAELRKRMEQAEEREELAQFSKRAGDLQRLGFTPAKHAGILRKIAKALSKDEVAEFNRVLDAAATVAKTSDLFSELGTGEDAEAQPLAKLEKMARERAAKSGGKETFHQAYAALLETEEGRDLYAASREN